jgi:hypothetical protein
VIFRVVCIGLADVGFILGYTDIATINQAFSCLPQSHVMPIQFIPCVLIKIDESWKMRSGKLPTFRLEGVKRLF